MKSRALYLKIAIPVLLLLLLFSDTRPAPELFAELRLIFNNYSIQWSIILILCIDFAAYLAIAGHVVVGYFNLKRPQIWLIFTFVISIMAYLAFPSPSVDALTFLFGIVLGLAVFILITYHRLKDGQVIQFTELILLALATLLVLASTWWALPDYKLDSRVYLRWCGPWKNPNIAGLMMGVGVLLAFAFGIAQVLVRRQCQAKLLDSHDVREKLLIILYFVVFISLSTELLRSMSRGAFWGTICALGYLTFQIAEIQKLKVHRLSGKTTFYVIVICVSMGLIILLQNWQINTVSKGITRRIISVGNANDFSWRNRIITWGGALQIIADYPWFGSGWNRPELLYQNYYLPSKLDDGAAFVTNDYLLLGARLGLPALFCFGMYLWLSLVKNLNSENLQLDWLIATCRAGVVVFLVGFWFDGGLFELPTAATFWILQELGAAGLVQQSARKKTKTYLGAT